MSTTAAMTLIKMLEALPDQLQDRALEHMREYLEDLRDETKWAESFSRTQKSLVEAARHARQEISEGKSASFDSNKL
jgi:hypothetical protein